MRRDFSSRAVYRAAVGAANGAGDLRHVRHAQRVEGDGRSRRRVRPPLLPSGGIRRRGTHQQ